MVSEPLIWREALFWPGGAANAGQRKEDWKRHRNRTAGHSFFIYFSLSYRLWLKIGRGEKFRQNYKRKYEGLSKAMNSFTILGNKNGGRNGKAV
jgi:hypothetical protein